MRISGMQATKNEW